MLVEHLVKSGLTMCTLLSTILSSCPGRPNCTQGFYPLHATWCAGLPCSRLFLTDCLKLDVIVGFADMKVYTVSDHSQLLGMPYQCM